VGRDWVLLAEVDRPRGLRGEVVARLHADDPSRLDSIDTLRIVAPGGEPREVRLEGWKRKGERVVLKLSGVDTVEDAEELRNSEILVARSSSPAQAPEGRFFAHQLEGLRVLTRDGRELGRVDRLLSPSGQTLLVVAGERGEILIPLVEAICVEIDPDGGLIRIDPPDGLVDLNAV
jgi:16S rRNA processing protein RimM